MEEAQRIGEAGPPRACEASNPGQETPIKMAELAAFDDNESLAKDAKQQAMEMSEAETGRLPQGRKPVADNAISQVSPIRKENLPYDVCPRCGSAIGWMKRRYHEGHAYMWCKAGYKTCSWKESAPIQVTDSSAVPSTPPRKRASPYVDAVTPPKPSSAPRLTGVGFTYL